MPDHARGLPAEARETGHDRRVVGELAVAVNLRPLVEQVGDEVERVRALGVPRHQRLLPRSEVGEDFLGGFGKLLLQFGDDSRVRIRRSGFFDLAPEPENRLLELRRIAIHGA